MSPKIIFLSRKNRGHLCRAYNQNSCNAQLGGRKLLASIFNHSLINRCASSQFFYFLKELQGLLLCHFHHCLLCLVFTNTYLAKPVPETCHTIIKILTTLYERSYDMKFSQRLLLLKKLRSTFMVAKIMYFLNKSSAERAL